MSILDKASLIQIPSGYKSTKLYSLRPSNGTGDFTFARSSSGTRVNSQGLIETAQVVSTTELVTNGDFATDSNWTKGIGWTINNNKAIATNTPNGSLLYQSKTYSIGIYKVVANINIINGSLRFQIGGGFISETFTTSGEKVFYINVTSQQGYFGVATQTDNSNFTIDNVSVKEVIENDVPRLDYSDGSCASLLLEGQSTNLFTHSEDFSEWNLFNATTTLNFATSPSGETNAVKITSSATYANVFVTVSKSSSALNYTQSVFVKAVNYSIVNLISYGSSSGNRAQVSFDLSDGSVSSNASTNGSFANPSQSIENYGNGWYRCSLSFTSDTSSEVRPYMQFPIQMTNDNYVLLYGAQLENQSYPTTLINTIGSSVTRNADACSLTNVADRINSSEGVLFVETSYVNKGYGNSIAITDGTNSQRVQVYFNNNDLSLLLVVKVNDTIVGTHTVSSSGINWDSTNKIAIKYKTNDMSFWLNGTKVGTDTSGTMFSANTLTKLGFDSGSGGSFYGKCNQIQVYNTALSDSELAALTT